MPVSSIKLLQGLLCLQYLICFFVVVVDISLKDSSNAFFSLAPVNRRVKEYF